jgi:hypothetical protein
MNNVAALSHGEDVLGLVRCWAHKIGQGAKRDSVWKSNFPSNAFAFESKGDSASPCIIDFAHGRVHGVDGEEGPLLQEGDVRQRTLGTSPI